jgi:ParB family chromosome partitioning protein
MMDQLQLSQEQVAAKVGLQRSTVANQLRLLELPESARQALAKGLIQMGHARALLGAKSEADQLAVLERTVREDLSVRSVEDVVRQMQRSPSASAVDSKVVSGPRQSRLCCPGCATWKLGCASTWVPRSS